MRNMLKNVIAICIALMVGLAIAELFLRAAFPQTLSVWTQTRDGLITLRPSFDLYLPKFGTTVHTNSFGFRDIERKSLKQEGTYRILLVGDSFMEALQVEFEESLPHLLEEKLNTLLYCPVEVINAGVSGWGTDDEVTYLARRGVSLRPNLVLFAFTLHNDVNDNLEERYHMWSGTEYLKKPLLETSLLRHLNLELRSYLISHSHVYQAVYQGWQSLNRARAGTRLMRHVLELMDVKNGEMAVRGWDMTRWLFSEAKALLSKSGTQIAAFSIPLIYQLDDEAYKDLLESARMRPNDIDPDKPGNAFNEVLHQESIQSIDILAGFREWIKVSGRQDLYLKGDGHWNRKGHRLAVDIIVPQIVDIIKMSPPVESPCFRS